MKKLLLLFVFIFGFSFGQTDFKFTENVLNDYIITQVPKKTGKQLYSKTIEWIKKTYNNPNAVIISTIDNDYIRIKAISDSNTYFDTGMFKHDCKIQHEVNIQFKDGRYKLTIEDLKMVDKEDYNKYQLTKPYKESYEEGRTKVYLSGLPDVLNNLNNEIMTYIKSEEKW